MSTLYLVQGDNNPRANFTITYTNGTAMNLTGSTVNFIFRKFGSNEKLFERTCVLNEPTEGTCYYDWQSGDLDTAGDYIGELEVHLPTDKIQTIKTPMSFVVRPQLD